MPTQISRILRCVNRDLDRPLNILCSPTHEAYETMLCKTGHRFYSLQHPNLKRWNCRSRPYPINYQPINHNALPNDVVFDMVLSQSKWGQFQILGQIAHALGCPLIQLEHTIPIRGVNEQQIKQMKNMNGTVNVYICKWSADQWWDSTGVAIEHGIDTNIFCGWNGAMGGVLSVVNQFRERDSLLGFSLWKNVTNGLQTNLVGDNPGLSQEATSTDDLVNRYRVAGVFLNTSLQSTYPMAMIEAMAVGCPVVSTPTCAIPTIIQDGVNGMLGYTPEDLRSKLELLLRDKELARTIGEAGRQTVLHRFGESRFIDDWNNLFRALA